MDPNRDVSSVDELEASVNGEHVDSGRQVVARQVRPEGVLDSLAQVERSLEQTRTSASAGKKHIVSMLVE